MELIPELEEVRHGTEALQALEAERAVRPFVEAEAAESAASVSRQRRWVSCWR